MMEWALWMNGLEKVFVFAVAIIGFLIRRALSQQADVNMRSEAKIDEILQQVRATNGRVGRLEEWKQNHTRETDGIHSGMRDQLKGLWERLNNHLDGTNNGGHR